MKRLWFSVVTVAAVMTLGLSGALATTGATPGVSSTTIDIGATFPLSGPVSFYAPIAKGMKAYFSYVNSRKATDGRRGVNGRQIHFNVLDDQYIPANAVQATRQLVEQDHVFAMVGGLGTANQVAVRDYLNQMKVPQVFVSTGATTFGADYKKYPWTIGWQPTYHAEGSAYAKYLKDPGDASQRKDSGIKLYFRLMNKYGPSGARLTDILYLYGMAKARTFVTALYQAGKNPTRDSLMKAVRHLNETNPFLLKAIKVQTSPTDPYPICNDQLVQYNNGSFTAKSELLKGC